jgi:PIN domain nuclease of toxin-antitoxin system
MSLVLDTHVFLWLVQGSADLLPKHKKTIEQAEQGGHPIGISIITLWEVALLAQHKRVKLEYDLDLWLRQFEAPAGLTVYPLSVGIILDSVRLGTAFPRDPADRLIAATARSRNATLLTIDQKIITSGVVATM